MWLKTQTGALINLKNVETITAVPYKPGNIDFDAQRPDRCIVEAWFAEFRQVVVAHDLTPAHTAILLNEIADYVSERKTYPFSVKAVLDKLAVEPPPLSDDDRLTLRAKNAEQVACAMAHGLRSSWGEGLVNEALDNAIASLLRAFDVWYERSRQQGVF